MKNKNEKKLVALLTNNDDDIYCFRKELIEDIIAAGYEMLISCPDGEKFELMRHIEYRYDDPVIDRRGTNIIADLKLFIHYFTLFVKNKPSVVLTYTAKPNVYAGLAAWLLRIPVISNVTGFGSVLNEGGLKQKLIMSLFRFSFRRSACVMFQNSTNMKLAEESGMVKGEHILIPGSGVNTERYPLQPYPDGGDGKNALSRILAPIRLEKPVLSEHSCPVTVYRQDANALAGTLPPLDLAYLDPPYNQHPYGSNYFMLNLLTDYRVPEKVSPVSGIPADWNKSAYNRRAEAADALETLCRDLPAKYLLISFSDDGFISREQMLQMLQPLGDVTVLEQIYNTFRGSRNLRARETHVKEILYLVKKR